MDAPCPMGVGCYETGVCYAEANGRPEMCPLRKKESDVSERLFDFIAMMVAVTVVTLCFCLFYGLFYSFVSMDWTWFWEFGRRGRILVAATYSLLLFIGLRDWMKEGE